MRSENSLLQLHAGNRLDTYGFTVPLAGRYQFALLRPYSFAYFDIKILEREGAEKDYTEEELHKVAELDKVITDTEKDN